VVAVEHHVLGVDLGDGVDRAGRHAGRFRAGRRAVELHAHLHALGQVGAGLEEHQRRVVVAEGMLGLEVQHGVEAGVLVGQRFLDLLEQILAAVEEFQRLGELVDQVALSVLEAPGQRDDAGGGDEHRGMIAQSPP